MRVLNTRVAGVTFEGRQQLIEQLDVWEAVLIVPEPENPYDKNALAVYVAHGSNKHHVGYIPRELASEIAPHLEGESVLAEVCEITGGFQKLDGTTASFGLRIRIEIPD